MESLNDDFKNFRLPLTMPFLDDSILANLDKIISIFQGQDDNTVPTEEDVKKVLNDLNIVKSELERIFSKLSPRVSEFSSASDFNDKIMKEEVCQNIQNFRTMKNEDSSKNLLVPKKTSESSSDSKSQRSSMSRKYSTTSLRNSLTVAPCSFSRRQSNQNLKQLTQKTNRHKQVGRSYKIPNVKEETKDEQNPKKSTPKIIDTHYATCRIHSYENESYTFEIIKPERNNCYGDVNEKSDIVIVVLANGQAGVFCSKPVKSLAGVLSFCKTSHFYFPTSKLDFIHEILRINHANNSFIWCQEIANVRQQIVPGEFVICLSRQLFCIHITGDISTGLNRAASYVTIIKPCRIPLI
ncbi:CLUMA_CG014668, isoform A [Clunio marinus]|uniref:CLUMA_CG014668, isoform A n=1 Tax=Clunio marinus TaxID=568069 RepID=A0A1J1ILX0_9DIPT|nr:CLUMA_CG014668, isoform A [Clunio marinus]